MRTTLPLLLLLGLHFSHGNPHHGGLHAEHRMTTNSDFSEAEEASDRISRSGGSSSSGWPDSQSLWADIPTSQSFLHGLQWKPEPALSQSAKQTSDDVFFGSDRKRNARPPQPTQFDGFNQQVSPPNFGDAGISGGLHYQPPEDSYHYNVRYEENPAIARPKRQPNFNSPQGPEFGSHSQFEFPSSVQFDHNTRHQQSSRPPLEQYTSYPKTFEAPGHQGSARPLRHITRYPGTFEAPELSIHTTGDETDFTHENDDNFDFKPSFQGFGGKSHSYSTFEAPQVANNVFIDHSIVKEPSPPAQRPQFLPSRPSPENGFQPIAKKDNMPYEHFPDAPYNYAEPDTLYRSVPSSPAYEDYDYEPTQPYRKDRGQIGDESFDRENKEENGMYQVKNYHQPLRGMKYEADEPIDIQDYGNDYAGLETFQGGYDSEDDAKRGIVRSYHHGPNEAPDRLFIEDEPMEDYNREGYYVPREGTQGASKKREGDDGATHDTRYTEAMPPSSEKKDESDSYQRYRSPISSKSMRPRDRYVLEQEEEEEGEQEQEVEGEEAQTPGYSKNRRRPSAAARPQRQVRPQRHHWS